MSMCSVAFLVIAFLAAASALRTGPRPLGGGRCRAVTALSAAIDPNWPGEGPFGLFDPLGLSEGATPEDLRRWRESEVKHGRLAMIAAPAIIVSEQYHPFFPLGGASVTHFDQMESFIPYFWVIPTLWSGIFELYSIAAGWEPGARGLSTIRPDYIPGDLNFDPLGLGPKDPGVPTRLTPEFASIRSKELNNGRLAMIAVAGLIAQELVDGQPILEHLRDHGLSRGL